MSTTTLNQNKRCTVFARNLGSASRSYFGDSESQPGQTAYIVEGQPVFRTGTFRDSMGDEATWDKSHMDQMVFHFQMLRDNGIFPDVPVRKGHPDSGSIFGGDPRNCMDELVGYVTSLKAQDMVNPVDNQTYTYLIANFEILDEEAQGYIQNSLWRNVSAEIGTTVTNNNAEYWPVFSGVAYVDRPAVEGLKKHAMTNNQITLIMEDDMTTPVPPVAPVAPVAPAVPVAPVAPVTHAAPTPVAPHVFTIAGAQVTDLAAVQAVLDEVADLRSFRQVTEENARDQFVQGLISSNKIAITQKDEAAAFVKAMSTDQFAAYSKLMEAAPAVGMLANHGGTGNTPLTYSGAATGQPQPQDQRAWRISVLKGQLQTHKLAGMKPEKIQGLGSYKEMLSLDPQFTLASI